MIKIRPELLNLFLVADANDNPLMEEKKYHNAKITFNVFRIVQTLKQCRGLNKNRFEVSKTCLRNNPDTNIPASLVLSSTVILSNLRVLLNHSYSALEKIPVFSFYVSSQAIDFNQYWSILFAQKRHTGYKTL